LLNCFPHFLEKFFTMIPRIQKFLKSQQLKHAIDASTIIAITDPRGIITYANKRFCEISKYSNEELLGKDHKILNSGYHSKKFFKEMWETIQQGKTWKGVIKNKTKDGSFYWVNTTIVPILNKDSKPERYIAIRTDITNQKENELKIKKQTKELTKKFMELKIKDEVIQKQIEELHKVDKLKEEFAAMISHELRTPLTPIIMWCDVLKEADMYGELNSEQNQVVEKIRRSADSLAKIIDDVLDIQKLELGKLKFDFEVFKIEEIIKEVQENINELGSEKNVTVSYYAENLTLTSDRKRILQVLQNLAINSIDFVPEIGGKIKITANEKNGNVKFSVQDNGIGISKENHEKIFKKFEQIDSSQTRSHGGSGLGLAVSKSIVEKLGGKMWVKSDLGYGSAFFFTIPFKKGF